VRPLARRGHRPAATRVALALLALAAAAAVALPGEPAGGARSRASAAGTLLGVSGSVSRFQGQTGQDSSIDQGFLGWGQGATYGAPFAILLPSLGPIPMLHLGTKGQNGKESITPGDIAAGKGDAYLVALNRAIAVWGRGIYVRPMAEMNNYVNYYSAYDSSGAPRDATHSTASYRKAFQRIYVILHGGTAAAIDAKLKALGMPPLNGPDEFVNPFPRLRILWSPLAGGNPRVAGNAPSAYFPGAAYVDVEGGDIYDEGGTAPWSELDALASAAAGRHEPFSVPEWGLSGIDDPTFVTQMCSFLKAHGSTEASVFYESRPGSKYDLGDKPRSAAAYRSCVVPLAATLPTWASGNGATAIALALTPKPATGAAPLAVTFSIAAKLSVPIQQWQLVFGDGSSQSGAGQPPASVAHTYGKAGIFQALLFVYDAPPFAYADARFYRSATVTAGAGAAPLVSFVPSPAGGKAPLAVSFRTDLSLPAKPTSWTVVLGDGNTRTGTGVPPHFLGHTYETNGSYTALLLLNGPASRVYAATAAVAAGGAPPVTTTTTTTKSSSSGPPPTGKSTGTVLVGGRPFKSGIVPLNTPVDVTNGRLTLTSDTGTITVYGAGVHATFVILRTTSNGKKVLEFKLTGGDFSVCKRKKASARATVKTIRRLWGDAKGNFQTKGRYAAATVRGTLWLTADRCDGTFVQVNRGIVAVTSKTKTTLVRAGQHLLTKP
jgi:PKD repeat protein